MRHAAALTLILSLSSVAISAFSREPSVSPPPARRQVSSTADQSPRSVLDGVYTDEQAKRGAALNETQCARCHNGTSAVSFTDDTFWSKWKGQKIYPLYDVMRRTMPLLAEGTLSPQEYADIIAYILSANHFPAGKTELQANPDVLKEIRFQAKPVDQGSSQPQVSPEAQPSAAQVSIPTPEEVDAALAADVDTITPRPHLPAKYWIDLMPEDPNKALVVRRCSFCHDMQRAIAYARPKEQWEDVVEAMIKRGTPVTRAEFPLVVDYLAKYFGPDSKPRGGAGMQPCKESEWPKGSADFRKPWGNSYTIWASNQQGNHVDIINPAINKVVRRIGCIEAPDRAEFSPDGNTAYIPSRMEHNITVVDTRTGAIKAKIPVLARPNVSVLTKDGKQLIIAIWPVNAEEGFKGYLQVLDTTTLKIVQTIDERGGMHDVWMSKGGEMFVSMPGAATHDLIANKFMDAFETETKKLLWTCCTNDPPIDMMEMELGSDGTTSRILVSERIGGFLILDAKTGKELQRVKFPIDTDGPCAGYKPRAGFHGNEVSPDGKSVWLTTQDAFQPCGNIVYRYSLPGLQHLGHVHLASLDQTGQPFKAPIEGAWLTISPDGKTVYVGRAGRNMIAVIDVASMKEVTRIPVGEYPLHLSIWPRGTP